MKNKLILASASPRRLDLLKQIHVTPERVVASEIDETPLKGELPRALALRLAIEKAQYVFNVLPPQNPPSHLREAGQFILAADTVVACGRRILPKAETEKEIRQCLALLSGRRHRVHGGIALIAPDGTVKKGQCETVVQFKKLTETEIADYVASGEGRGKAGGYAIQGLAAGFIKFIGGSYSNVVGLSLYDTMKILRGAGLSETR